MKYLLMTLFLAACSDNPAPTGAECPSPDPMTLTYDNFGRDFMDRYCTWCHDSSLTHSMRNGAPLYHDFDTLIGVLEVSNHVDEQSGSGPNASNHFMPPSRCPSTKGGALDKDCTQPTEEERKNLAIWLACEKNRPH